MRLNEGDVARLVTACKLSQENTGSEYIWDEYEELIHKLNKPVLVGLHLKKNGRLPSGETITEVVKKYKNTGLISKRI